jgi:uncharacterized protein (TIGR02757 family)
MAKALPLIDFLNTKVDLYNQPSFISTDPISIPHLFTRKPDIEIAAFFAAIFSWGNRTTIIQKGKELMQLMEMQPYQFCLHHDNKDLERLLQFKHRTFTTTDLLYFIEFLKFHYSRHKSLESAFLASDNIGMQRETTPVIQAALTHFHHYFFSLEHVPARTKKHVSTPERKSTCKRLNMFLRWMVRRDDRGVDFGIWKRFSPADLIIPIDLHVARVARRFNLLSRKQTDWQAALELTSYLKKLDKDDPVKYDFALFGLGVIEKFG